MFSGFQPRANLQNYTMVPNEFFDTVMSQIESMAELKIVLAVLRKTYGWIDTVVNGVPVYKVEDDISYSQFKELTGLAESSVGEGIKRAIEHGFIEKVRSGTLNGPSSRYRLTQRVKEGMAGANGGQITVSAQQKESTEKVARRDVPPVQTASASEVTPLCAEIVFHTMPSKSEIVDDMWGRRRDGEEKPKEKGGGKQSFRTKNVTHWNCNDLLGYFADRYFKALNIPYIISSKDRMLAKKLLDEGSFVTLDIVKVIDYYLKNYQTMAGLPTGYPSWGVFYGWRNTIFPTVLVGEDKAATRQKAKNMSVREYQEPTVSIKIANDWDD